MKFIIDFVYNGLYAWIYGLQYIDMEIERLWG